MVSVLTAMFWLGLELLLMGVVLFYAGLVTVVYLTEGLRYGPPFDWHDPARAAANLLIWAGVKSVRAIVRVAKPAYEMFSDTSAEFGAWLLGHRRAEVEAAVWSRIRH